jgi:hypothetical protein
MAIKLISNEEAFSEGADIWVLATPTFSEWTKRLDWPLNLQISKASNYLPKKLSPELMAIVQQNDLKFDTTEPEKKNLIIASEGMIPASRVVIVPGENWETWSKAAVKMWQDLNQPPARFFIPAFAKWDKVKNSWPSAANIETVEIVEAEG